MGQDYHTHHIIALALANTGLAVTTATMLLAGPAHAEVIAPGATVQINGTSYSSTSGATIHPALSSEFASVSVLAGDIRTGNQTAHAGEVLVTPIESGLTERFLFDAAKLARTLSPDMAEAALPLLEPIIARQKRQRFWGRLETVGVNVQAPAPVPAEDIRRAYLSDPVVVELRRFGGGNLAKLTQATALRFVGALAAGDATIIAALIDPKPFTDGNLDSNAWRSARQNFANRLAADQRLVSALGGATTVPGPVAAIWLVGPEGAAPTHRLTLTARDRAVFVSSLEAVQ